MGLEQLRQRSFWKTVALAIVAAALAYACLGLTDGMPRWARALTGGFGLAFAGATALMFVLVISELRSKPVDRFGKRTRARPEGGVPREAPHEPQPPSSDRDDDNGR